MVFLWAIQFIKVTGGSGSPKTVSIADTATVRSDNGAIQLEPAGEGGAEGIESGVDPPDKSPGLTMKSSDVRTARGERLSGSSSVNKTQTWNVEFLTLTHTPVPGLTQPAEHSNRESVMTTTVGL